jgi:flavin reductase (DIM6/NTAB) family NADH-FMN oxidoreductase RutF
MYWFMNSPMYCRPGGAGTLATPTDPNQIRLTMRAYASGVTIITARVGEEVHGMTATAVCSVSLAPPLLLVCVVRWARTHGLIAASGAFAVNLLHQGQRELADRFGGRRPDIADRFCGVGYHHAVTGAPILDDSLGYFDCRVVAAHDGGDHTIFVGQIEATGRTGARRPLIYHQGDYLAFPTLEQAGIPLAETVE